MTNRRHGAVAAATLAITALFVAGPAAAAAKYVASSGNYYASAHLHSCWQYSSRSEHWVDVCRTYSYRYDYPRTEPIHPGYGKVPYPYRYEPPINSNGPYAGYEPYNGYQSALGFSF
jgi:hypothetical protein